MSLFCGTVPLVFCTMSMQKWENPCLCRCAATRRSMYFLFTLLSIVPSLSSPGRVRGAFCALSEGSKLSSMLLPRPCWWNTARCNCGTKCRLKASRSCSNPFRRVREKCGLNGRQLPIVWWVRGMFQGGGNEGGSCEDCFDRGLWNEANWRWGGCFWECVMRSSQEADDSGPHQEGECACSCVVAERPQCLVLLEPIPFSWPYVVCYCVVCLLVKWRVCCLIVEWWMEYNTHRRWYV